MAVSSFSKTKIVDPSAITKPSLFLSKGLQASLGDSLFVDKALIWANAPIVIGVVPDSVPPAITVSTTPRSIRFFASPTELADAAHAVVIVNDGPSIPNLIATCPVLEFGISWVIARGFILEGPLVS